MHRRLLFIILLIIPLCVRLSAQEKKAAHDSLKIERDSLRAETDLFNAERDSLNTERDSLSYAAIETYSKKSKFTRFIHQAFFKSVIPKPPQSSKNNLKDKAKLKDLPEGKIIREILITTLDPFGYDLRDTSKHPKIFLMKAGNELHIKTLPVIIKNLLIFKKNEPYDSVLVNESIRLIRSQNYVRDLYLYSAPVSGNNDSVDVYIRVSDIWNIVPALSMSGSSSRIGLTDINFAGLGNRLQGEIFRNRAEDYSITRLSYLAPNIRKSFINLNIQYLFPGSSDMITNYDFVRSYYSPVTSNFDYLFSENKDIVRSIELERTFYSPVAKWAGGIFIGQMVLAQNYIRQDTIRYIASLANIQDYWGAKSWQILKGYPSRGRISSFVVAGRLVNTSYPKRSNESVQANLFNRGVNYFAGIGITSRKYIKDQYIYNYGKIEDIPVGQSAGLTFGFDSQQAGRFYFGLNGSFGNYFKFGYLSTHLEYGTYKTTNGFQQGVVTGRINYFTNLLNSGNWKLRQFIRPTFIFGIDRLPSDNLTLTEGMKGFEGLEYSATKMMVLNLQTQTYPPWNLFGFHFGPYLFSYLGMLGNRSTGLFQSKLYSSFGAGVLIKNNYLTFNTIQISMTFYPFVPGNGYNVFIFNAYKTSDYGFRDFEISKPGVVSYR